MEAGRRGGFGLVIGVDRTGKPERLKEHGAHVVVSDLAEVTVGGATTGLNMNTADLPSALESIREILKSRAQRVAVFTDYGGTLTPIVDSQTVKTPDQAGERGYEAGKKIKGRKRHLVEGRLSRSDSDNCDYAGCRARPRGGSPFDPSTGQPARTAANHLG